MNMDTTLLSKYRGCLLGALLGDCLGEPYEGFTPVSRKGLQQYFDKLSGPYFEAPVKPYTDDTAMTRSLAKHLISNRGLEPRDLAKRFTVEYFNEPRRGYGQNVVDVFFKLKEQEFEDPFGPASEQFSGLGSYGNGGAMRIAPVALFYHKNLSEVIENARLSAKVTHSNKKGIDGAVLQAVAIQQSLQANPKEELNHKEFTNQLLQTMSTVENEKEGLPLLNPSPYKTQLKVVQDLLDVPGGAEHEAVQQNLGTSVCALYSVPTAIYCFLRSFTSIPEVETENPFQRTIQYAISLGGDTDTIGSMAGAIAGAYYGESIISESLRKHCEASQDMVDLADSLFDITA